MHAAVSSDFSRVHHWPDSLLPRYANRSLRFLNAYRRGLNGKWAAYVAKEYRGHRVLPLNLFDGLRAKGYACSLVSSHSLLPHVVVIPRFHTAFDAMPPSCIK
ncbi:hypothetical protein B0H13DRAFT_1630559 [Mycena leptocephala]|nr:hypothetical protein B0H13DRAFT_1630559 [Mycena leptocephala]